MTAEIITFPMTQRNAGVGKFSACGINKMISREKPITVKKSFTPYTVGAITNWFLQKSKETETPINLQQLMALLYIAHGWHLAFKGKPLINERFKAVHDWRLL